VYIKKLLIVIVFGFAYSSLFAANSTYYNPEGTVRERLKEGIEYTRHSVDMCIHDFAALEIAEYLDVARNRGVRVRAVILEQGNDNQRGSLSEILIHKGFDVRVLKRQLGENPLQDFVVFDNRLLVTGAYNWLAYRNRNICNDVLFQYDSEKIQDYKNTFCRLFTEAEAVPFTNDRKELVASNNPPVTDTVSGSAGVKQTIQGNILESEQVAAEESPKPVTEVIPRDFIDVSIEEMDKQFGRESSLSRSEKNELWKKYKGKYVRWRGVVAYKGMGRVDWNRIGVNRKSSKNAEVEILFDWRMFEKVMDVRIGRTITYTGKLVSRPVLNAPYRLDDGDIE